MVLSTLDNISHVSRPKGNSPGCVNSILLRRFFVSLSFPSVSETSSSVGFHFLLVFSRNHLFGILLGSFDFAVALLPSNFILIFSIDSWLPFWRRSSSDIVSITLLFRNSCGVHLSQFPLEVQIGLLAPQRKRALLFSSVASSVTVFTYSYPSCFSSRFL